VRGGRWTILGYRGRVVLRTSARELGRGVTRRRHPCVTPGFSAATPRASASFDFNNDPFPIVGPSVSRRAVALGAPHERKLLAGASQQWCWRADRRPRQPQLPSAPRRRPGPLGATPGSRRVGGAI
jgi:hypothetical protein